MTKGKIILGAVAALVTVSSTLAFKVAKKNTHKILYGATKAGNLTCSVTCRSLRTAITGSVNSCPTLGGKTAPSIASSTWSTVKSTTSAGCHKVNKAAFQQ